MPKLINNFFRRQPSPWECIGGRDGKPFHPSFVNNGDFCQICGAPRPGTPDDPEGSTDIYLLIALIIFNLGSGFTTIYGALKIFPWLVGITSGAAIQALLFLLVSGSTAKHAPRLKWLTIASLSTISIYTSFFAYYDAIAGRSDESGRIEQAQAAHQNLIQEVYNPIEQKAVQLKSDIETQNKLIKEEAEGRRGTGRGCGSICQKLIKDKEKLLAQQNKLQPIVKNLRPLFEYEVGNKSPQEIFNADIKALAKVPKNCLPENPKFDCFPPQYEGNLDPRNPKYKELRKRYFDPNTSYQIITPFNKIRNGEMPAIFAAVFALMVDGLIIALGTAIKVPDKKNQEDK